MRLQLQTVQHQMRVGENIENTSEINRILWNLSAFAWSREKLWRELLWSYCKE